MRTNGEMRVQRTFVKQLTLISDADYDTGSVYFVYVEIVRGSLSFMAPI